MPKIDLSAATRIKNASGNIRYLRSANFGWDATGKTQFSLLSDTIQMFGGVMQSRTDNSYRYISNSSDSRRRMAWPIFPEGTKVSFTLTTTGQTYIRMAADNALGPTGTTELVPTRPTGTHQIEFTMPAIGVNTHMGVLVTGLNVDVQITNFIATYPNHVRAPAYLMSDYYGIGPGKVGVHLSPKSAVLDANNLVTNILNYGAAGSLFDATLSGNVTKVSDLSINFADAAAVGNLANPVSLMDVHFVFVAKTNNITNGTRIFGYNSGSSYEIRFNVNGSGQAALQLWSNSTGTPTNVNAAQRFAPDNTWRLFEFRMLSATNQILLSTNGVTGNAQANPWTDFLVQTIGRGVSGTLPFTGELGEMTGVVMGSDTAVNNAAILGVRNYFNNRYNLGITI